MSNAVNIPLLIAGGYMNIREIIPLLASAAFVDKLLHDNND